LWVRLHAEHPRTGLWPLALHGLDTEPDRPWVEGEVFPAGSQVPPVTAIEGELEQLWVEITSDEDDENEDDAAERVALIAPYSSWPGLAPTGEQQGSPDERADEYARQVLDGSARLGLVIAGSGAEALATIGWTGPANYVNPGLISAVLATWEERFGARVIGLGFDTLRVSVTAPPTTIDQALLVAAEHFAFCPDNVWQGEGSLAVYAEDLVGATSWTFWWD
jgi:hypothetical protein